MNETERKFKEKSTVSRKFTIPQLFWEEWEKDCKSGFNDTYHLKMQFDHEFRKQFQHISNLLIQDMVGLQNEVFELKAIVADISGKLEEIYTKEEKSSTNPSGSSKVATFGKRKEENE